MPAKKRTLKELIRERTSGPDAHKEVTEELFKGSDRSVAILLAADIEGALGE